MQTEDDRMLGCFPDKVRVRVFLGGEAKVAKRAPRDTKA